MRHHGPRVIGTGPLYVDLTPVTNEAYAQFLVESDWRPVTEQNWLKSWDAPADEGGLPRVPPGDERRPVNWVSRDDAQEYCKHYGKRLPETWEWQYAASNGDPDKRFPWGNDADCATCTPPHDDGRETPKPYPVDAHPDGASAAGLLDMWGDIFEWTSEFQDEHSAKAVVRGGHFWRGAGTQWYFPRPADLLEHNTLLLLSDSMDRSAGIGFRCVAIFGPGSSAV